MAIVNSYQTAEYGKFVQLDNSTFPAVSVTRIGYYDASSAFPGNTGTPTYSAVDVYPKYAVLTHLTNASDISVSLSAGDLNVYVDEIEAKLDTANTLLNALTANTDSIEAKQDTANSLLSSQLGQSGFVFLTGGATAITGNFSTVQVVSACKIASIAATNSDTNGLTDYELPVNFSFNGPITSISLTYGAAFVYKL